MLNTDIFLFGDVTKSSPVLHREYCIQDGNLVPRFSLGRARRKFPLYDACSIANVSTGVLCTRVNPETCRIRVDGRIRFQTWKFLNPEGKCCGFGNIRVRVAGHKALSTCIRIFLKPVKGTQSADAHAHFKPFFSWCG